MQIKMIDAPTVGGGKALALCDDAGEVIGDQMGVVIENRVGEFPTATVTFLVDGSKLRFADDHG